MVVDINVITIVGRITKDAEMKHNKLMPVLFFTIATNRKKKNQDGSSTAEASFFDINVFGKYAETMIDKLKKSVQVIITGELKQERWIEAVTNGHIEETYPATNKSRVIITAHSIQIVGGEDAQ